MTIRASRSQFYWTPLFGWVVLACSLSPAGAQTSVPATPAGTTAPSTYTPPPPPAAEPEQAPPAATTTSTPSSPAPAAQPAVSPTVVAPANIVLPPVGSAVTAYPGINTLIGPPLRSSITTPVVGPRATSISSPIGGSANSNLEELGITLGAFRLYPSIDISTGYDTNVFAQSASQNPVGSPVVTIVPSLELRSQWLNHQLRGLLAGGFGFYSNAPTQNYKNYTLQVDGKVEILEDFYLTPLLGYRQQTEALGTPNVAFAQAPTVVDSVIASLGIYQRFNRFFYEITPSATRYWYTDHSTIIDQGLSAANRNRIEFEQRIRLGYELTDDLQIFIQPTFNQRRYVSPIAGSTSQERDSNGLNWGAGVTYIFSPTSRLEGIVGYQNQLYDGGLGNTSSYTYGLTGNWTGYSPLSLRPNISRSINESALSNYKNIISTNIAVDFTYELGDGWSATGGLSYVTAEYTPLEGSANSPPRTDTFIRGQLGLLYSIRPQVAIGPLFEYSQGTSTDQTNGPSFTRQIFSIRLTARR